MSRKPSGKFIPDSDVEFARVARNFALGISENPGKFFVAPHDSEMIMRRAQEFRDALATAMSRGTRTSGTVRRKDQARARAEQIIRRFANQIRVNPDISAGDKLLLHIKERPTRLTARKCPQSVPVLQFVGSIDGINAAMPTHVLRFWEYDALQFKLGQPTTRAKPAGAARLELFVELVEPDEPVPHWPGELGRPWYLRSFTKNPMHVEFPMPRRPMKVVYWARWADATGGAGPWSKTCVARVEGWHDAGALEDKRKGSRVVVSLKRRELPIVQRSDERKLLECDAPVEDRPRALPDAA